MLRVFVVFVGSFVVVGLFVLVLVPCFTVDRLPLSLALARSRFIFYQLLLKLRSLVHPDSKLQVPLDRQM